MDTDSTNNPPLPPEAKNGPQISSDTEDVMFDGRVPVKAFLGMHGFFYLILLGWNFGLLLAWLRSLSWKVKLTSQRLVITRGLVSQREEDIPLYRAKDCGFTQTVAGRMLGTGEVTLISDDATSPTVTFPIPEPKKYKEFLREFTAKERKRMRSMDLS